MSYDNNLSTLVKNLELFTKTNGQTTMTENGYPFAFAEFDTENRTAFIRQETNEESEKVVSVTRYYDTTKPVFTESFGCNNDTDFLFVSRDLHEDVSITLMEYDPKTFATTAMKDPKTITVTLPDEELKKLIEFLQQVYYSR